MTDESNLEQVNKIAYQLQALVNAVKSLTEIQNARSEVDESPTVYTVETSDETEMKRLLRATDALLALREIVDGPWQRGMIHHGEADNLKDKDGVVICPSDAMSKYRDQVFEIMSYHGIVLDDLM